MRQQLLNRSPEEIVICIYDVIAPGVRYIAFTLKSLLVT